MVEEVLEMLAYLTYYGTGISEALWSLWPSLHKMLVEWGIQVSDSTKKKRKGCMVKERECPDQLCEWFRKSASSEMTERTR